MDDSGKTPVLGTRAWVGLMPTRAWAAAGFWMEPPVSSAMPSTAMPEATAVALPADEAPGARSGATAVRVGPAQELLAWVPLALRTGTLVLPSRMAPAARMRATTGLSWAGIKSMPPDLLCSRDQPAVVGKPTMSIGSFTTAGTPASGGSFSPASRRRSMARASSSAWSLRKMRALRRGLWRSIWARWAWVSCSAVKRRAARPRWMSDTVRVVTSMSVMRACLLVREG